MLIWLCLLVLVSNACIIQPVAINKVSNAMRFESQYHKTSFETDCVMKLFEPKMLLENHQNIGNQDIYTTSLFDVDININELQTIPSAQTWSHCKNCIYTYNKQKCNHPRNSNRHTCFIAYSTSNSTNSPVYLDISNSLWSEFFHSDLSDQYHLTIYNILNTKLRYPNVNNSNNANEIFNIPKYVITNPVYILPIITMHTGHILVDVLEQVMHTM